MADFDPDKALSELREFARRALNADSETAQDDLDEMATVFDKLDVWLTQGSGLPSDWSESF